MDQTITEIEKLLFVVKKHHEVITVLQKCFMCCINYVSDYHI